MGLSITEKEQFTFRSLENTVICWLYPRLSSSRGDQYKRCSVKQNLFPKGRREIKTKQNKTKHKKNKNKTKQNKAKQSKAKQSKAKQTKACGLSTPASLQVTVALVGGVIDRLSPAPLRRCIRPRLQETGAGVDFSFIDSGMINSSLFNPPRDMCSAQGQIFTHLISRGEKS